MAERKTRQKTPKPDVQRCDLGRPTPATLDREAGTIWVTALPADAVAERYGMDPAEGWGPWKLRLRLDGMDDSRFVGAPFLVDHDASVKATIGVIDEFTVDGGDLRARVRFSSRADVAPVIDDIAAGILRGVSLGFTVMEYAAEGEHEGAPVFAAVRWQPYELSLTPTPAIAGATVLNRSFPMDEDTGTVAPVVEPVADKIEMKVQSAPEKKAAPARDVRQVFYAVGLTPEDADAAIDQRLSLEEINARAVEHMKQKGAAEPKISAVQVGKSYDDPAQVRLAMVDALAAKMRPGATLSGPAQKYRDYRLVDLAVELASAAGMTLENPRSPNSVFDQVLSGGFHSSADFPKLLEAAANKTLMSSYDVAAPTYRAWCAQRNFADFKAHKFLRIGDFPAFVSSPEPATVTFGTASENRESVTPVAYTTGIKFTREALINDDLGALANFAGMVGVRAAADENRLAYAALAANAALADGVTLFYATTHSNLAGTASTIDVANVALGVKAMRVQTSLDGLKLNLNPVVLVCGPAKELVAKQLLAAISPAVASNVNPYSGAFQLVVDANITGNEWYLFASPALAPVMVYGYVAGASGPEVWVTRDENTRGLAINAGLDFGVGAIDFRGAYKNAGA